MWKKNYIIFFVFINIFFILFTKYQNMLFKKLVRKVFVLGYTS